MIEINLRGTFLTCQAAARSMVGRRRPGKIITISSGAHASARPGGSHYCASKAGVVMFTKTLAMELAEARINVNCIAPGYIQADGAVSNSEFQRALLRNIPWGRFGTPADVAADHAVPGVIRGRLRDRRGVRGQRRGLCRANVSTAQYRDGAMSARGISAVQHFILDQRGGSHARNA